MGKHKGEKHLNLLVIDDDEYVIESIKMALPPHWKLTSGHQQGRGVVEGKFLPRGFVDIHLTQDWDQAQGIEVIRNIHQQQTPIWKS